LSDVLQKVGAAMYQSSSTGQQTTADNQPPTGEQETKAEEPKAGEKVEEGEVVK